MAGVGYGVLEKACQIAFPWMLRVTLNVVSGNELQKGNVLVCTCL
jgi:hypothetical protein